MHLVPHRASSGGHGRALPLASSFWKTVTPEDSVMVGVALCSWMSQEGRPGLVGFNPVEVNGKATHAKRENKRNGMARDQRGRQRFRPDPPQQHQSSETASAMAWVWKRT